MSGPCPDEVQRTSGNGVTACYPVLAILISARFHGERFTPGTLLGAVVAVAGVVVLFLR